MGNPSGSEGPFAVLKNLALTLLATGHTRLALIGNEIEMQKLLALRQLLLTQALMFCLGLGLLLLVALLTLLLWEQRIAVVAGFSLLFLALAAGCYAGLRRLRAEAEPVFAASLAELEEDLRQLKAATRHAQKPD